MAKILLADDSKDIGMIISERLRMDGHQVDVVLSGDKAIEKLKTNAYDIAILDVLMPGRDGLSVSLEVKTSQDFKKIPILITSAYKQDEKIIERSKADAFMPKPFELSHLSSLVKRLLQNV